MAPDDASSADRRHRGSGARPTALLPLGAARPDLALLARADRDRSAAVSRSSSHRLKFDGPGPRGPGPALVTSSRRRVAILAIIVQPTVGSISDYTVSRWGRRKPFIVVGSLLDVVFLVGIADGEHAPRPRRVRDRCSRSARTSRAARSRATCRTSSPSRRSARERPRRDDADPRQRHRLRPRDAGRRRSPASSSRSSRSPSSSS